MIVDLSPVNFVDATAVQRFDELREELTAQGGTLVLARVKRQLGGIFQTGWLEKRRTATAALTFPTLRSAVQAFEEASAAGTTGRGDAAEGCSPAALEQPTGGDPTGPSNRTQPLR